MISIDLEKGTLSIENEGGDIEYGLGTPQGFALLSKIWLRSGWDAKYVYSFSWMGRPIIQLPEDMIRMQEVIFAIQPDVIIETGVAHGGSLIFYASLCKALGKGRVIGIDIEIRPHNRKAIEEHPLFPYITLIEGSSVDPSIVEAVKAAVGSAETTIVILDSNHTKAHVLAELNAYASFVSINSYIVAMDGIMEQLVGAPRTQPDWSWNNPKQAAHEFVSANPNFVIEAPRFPFNEGTVDERITYSPDGLIRRIL